MLKPINLRVRTSQSHMRSTLSAKSAVKLAAADGQDAIGLIDVNGLGASLDFVKAAKDANIQPIVGRDFQMEAGFLTVIAQTQDGWQNLLKLSAAAARREDGLLGLSDFEDHSNGVIALAGAPGSTLRHAIAEDRNIAIEHAQRLHSVFGDRLVLEIQRNIGRNKAAEYEIDLVARALKLPMIATSLAASAPCQSETLLLLAAIEQQKLIDSPDLIRPAESQSFKTRMELDHLFQDATHLLDNAARLALSCSIDALPKTSKPKLPRFPDANGQEEAMLIEMARAGYLNRLQSVDPAKHSAYQTRLESELDVICKQGFAGYFLIVAEFISWSRSVDIPVGPGRGSGAGSAVAWAMGITDLDPIRWGLLFERFINPERVSLPDFDVDFCQDRRDEVIEHVRQKYGYDKVVAIGVNMNWGARAAFRDAARALGVPNGAVNSVAERLPGNEAYSIATLDPETLSAFRERPELMRALELAEPLQGFTRQHSRHAAGIIISDLPVAETVPVMRDPGGGDDLVTQYDMKAVEDAGLVKFDFLGLKTLSVIREACLNVKVQDPDADVPDIATIPFEDDRVFSLLNAGKCRGVFQLESEGMVKALRQIQVTRFEDIVALVALYRPGPMEYITTYAARKAGREPTTIPHPKLANLLAETHGILIYQEQIIELAQIMAGYSKGRADILRRAIGKKIQSEMDAQKASFIEGCISTGVGQDLGEYLFGLVDKFAGYGFNKSHAAAYALITWQTAWLKTHHPAAFYAAAMTYVADNHDKLRQMIVEAQEKGIELLPPRIGLSEADFKPERTKHGLGIRWGLGAIKGLGYAHAREVTKLTRQDPPRTIEGLAQRLAPLGNATVQARALGAAGVLDALHSNRAEATEHLISCLRFETQKGGVSFLFDLSPPAPPKLPDHSLDEKREQEMQTIGISFHDHPLAQYLPHQKRLAAVPIRRFREFVGMGALTILARVEGITIPKRSMTKVVRISDTSGEMECTSDVEVEPGAILVIEIVQKDYQSRARIVTARAFDPLDTPNRARMLLASQHDWPAILTTLTRGGRGYDRADIFIDLGEKGKSRKVLPACFSLDEDVISELAKRPDVLEATFF